MPKLGTKLAPENDGPAPAGVSKRRADEPRPCEACARPLAKQERRECRACRERRVRGRGADVLAAVLTGGGCVAPAAEG